MDRRTDAVKAVALVTGVTALVTAMVCADIYEADVRDAEHWRNRHAYEKECMKHFATGWSYDVCGAKAAKELEVSLREVKSCNAYISDNKEVTVDGLEKACGPSSSPPE